MNILDSHFSREEIACTCGCGFDTIDAELLVVLEKVREIIGAYRPNSVCRCVTHNRLVGSTDTSQHVKAKACDVPTNDPKSLYKQLDAMYPDKYGIGLYNSFVHIDVRNYRARW